MARTIFGEIRGHPFPDKLAVAWVIRNRADDPRWWGANVQDVCLKPYQFSCWNAGDPNLPKIHMATMQDPEFRSCFRAALTAYDRSEADPTKGATHYHTVAQPGYANRWPPEWANVLVPTVTVGPHKFYRET